MVQLSCFHPLVMALYQVFLLLLLMGNNGEFSLDKNSIIPFCESHLENFVSICCWLAKGLTVEVKLDENLLFHSVFLNKQQVEFLSHVFPESIAGFFLQGCVK